MNRTGRRIRGLRARYGLTRKEFSAGTGFDPETVARWERGETFPTAEELKHILATFSMSAEEFVGLEYGATEGKKEFFLRAGTDAAWRDKTAIARIKKFPGNGKYAFLAPLLALCGISAAAWCSYFLLTNKFSSADRAIYVAFNPLVLFLWLAAAGTFFFLWRSRRKKDGKSALTATETDVPLVSLDFYRVGCFVCVKVWSKMPDVFEPLEAYVALYSSPRYEKNVAKMNREAEAYGFDPDEEDALTARGKIVPRKKYWRARVICRRNGTNETIETIETKTTRF